MKKPDDDPQRQSKPRGGRPGDDEEDGEKSIETPTLFFRLRDDGILHGVARPERVQSLEDARVNLEAASRLTQGMPVPLLLDIRNTGTLSRAAREHYAGEHGARVITGLAFIADSAFTRVVGNLFIRVAKAHYPVRLFADEERAVRWLRSDDP